MIKLTVYCFSGDGYDSYDVHASTIASADQLAKMIIRDGLRHTGTLFRTYVPQRYILSISFRLAPVSEAGKEVVSGIG